MGAPDRWTSIEVFVKSFAHFLKHCFVVCMCVCLPSLFGGGLKILKGERWVVGDNLLVYPGGLFMYSSVD